jgi:glycosyltransferase involved in cell wall biosynthesis
MLLSVIIPSYNSAQTIGVLLQSIFHSRKILPNLLEIIIVDDHSTDETLQSIYTELKKYSKKIKTRIIVLKKNEGPAKARNIGVQYAKGKIVLFLDSDVILFPDTLNTLIQAFTEDPDLYALTGVWDKEQHSSSFFRKFKALRDWSYWINERDPKNYYYLFSTRIAAIKRDLFIRLGGFDTTYKAALVEDIELTYRIARRYAVVFNPEVRVHHEFEDFWPVAKKYFWRSYYWSKIYKERKKFDPVATTWKEAVATVSGGLAAAFSILLAVVIGIVFRIQNSEYRGIATLLTNYLSIATYVMFVIHFLTVRKFIVFCIKEEGWWFGLKAFITGILLYCFIIAGAVWSMVPV